MEDLSIPKGQPWRRPGSAWCSCEQMGHEGGPAQPSEGDGCSECCFTHIRDLRRIRPMLDSKTSSTIATSIVHSKLDYCNSLSFSVQIQHLQLIQNSLARAVTRTPRHHHNACP